MQQKFLTVMALLVYSVAGFSFKATNCSDASGDIRYVREKDDESEKISWMWQGSKISKREIKKGELFSETRINGDKDNGYFVAKVNFKTKNREIKIKDRWVMCQSVNTERGAALTDDLEITFAPFVVGASVSCSSTNGTTRKIGDNWYANNELISARDVVVYNSGFSLSFGGNRIYQIVVKYNDGNETLPQMIMCQ